MIILGKNSDDKGSQLEHLTKYLLTQLGYEAIVTNLIGAGGDEIDVSAEFRQPGMKRDIYHELVCECKAYKNPLNLPDWLKFLGKIYVKEHGSSGKIQGCFIALNGVNGNVHGNFKSLKNHNQELQIIEGEDLFELLNKSMTIQSIDNILLQLRSMTIKVAINTELLYYHNACYWLIEFSDEVFTLFSSDGNPLDNKTAEFISNLVIQNTGLREYVDLMAENTAHVRMALIEKYVLSVLLLSSIPMNIKSILGRKTIKDIRPVTGKVFLSDISIALKRLLGLGVVIENEEKYLLKTHLQKGTINNTIKFFQLFLQETIVLFAIGSKQYQSLIDKRLLNQIIKLQGNLKLRNENYDDYLNLLRWSPSALTWACNADGFLINHRKQGLQLNEQFDELGCSYFFQKLIDLFTIDYKSEGLRNYFLKKCNIVEVETELKIRIKSNERLLAQPHYKERFALGQMPADYNNVIVPILMLHDQPEPWERIDPLVRDT